MSDVEQVVALLSKVADKVGTTAEQGLPYLVRHEFIEGLVMLTVGSVLSLVGVIFTWKAMKESNADVMISYGCVAVVGGILGVLFVAFGIPQVLEPTGSVIGYVLKHAVK